MKFDKTQKRAIVFVAGLLGLSWYMGGQFEKADMMRSEGKLPCCPKPSRFWTMRGVMCRTCGKEDRIYRPAKEDSFNQMRSEADAYSYAYNEGHSDSRKDEDYQPSLASTKEEGRFRKILRQRTEEYDAETFEASNTKKPKLTPTQLKTLNMMKASTFYGGDRGNATRYAYVEVDNRGWKPYTTRPVQALLDKGIVTIGGGSRKFYGRVKSMEAYHVYLNPVAWEYPFQYDSDKSLSQVGDKIVQNAKVRQQQHARILKQKQDEENMTEDEMWDNLFDNSPELKEIYGFGAETFASPDDYCSACHVDGDNSTGRMYLVCDDCGGSYGAETFNAPYAGSGSLMNIGQDTSLGNFTSKELTQSSAIHGDFNEASLNYSGHQNLQVRGAETFDAETMTPSEVKVKVTKDVTPKGSKIIVEECVDIQAHKADATANFYRVRFRDPAEMSNFRVPAWAARAANTMGSKYYDVAGSKVTMGQDKTGNWKIQSVMVPKRANVDVALALKIANHIQDRLEKEGQWASKKCQDNERVLIIR